MTRIAIMLFLLHERGHAIGCQGRPEDSYPMYWNAEECGDGKGTSWIAISEDLGISWE